MRGMFRKRSDGALEAADVNAQKFLESIRVGVGVSVEAKRARNYRFHCKFFKLLELAFDIWQPTEKQYKSEPIAKNFERFREDILIMAGHYDAVFGIGGHVRFSAKSISFANMDEDAFQDVYQSVLNVVWDKILREANYASPDEVEEIVNQLLHYG
jgi:hypothetical protein